MRLGRGSAHAIRDDTAIIVVLMPVDEGIVHADIRHAADDDQRFGLQPLQKDFHLGPEETGIAPLGNEVVAG